MELRKKRIIINTDIPVIKTGLARNGKELVNYLYDTGKYEICYYACGCPWNNPDYERFPFLVHGTLPNNQSEVDLINRGGPEYARDSSYGLYNIDKIVQEFKPDVLIMSNDSWASEKYTSLPFWDKISCIPHKCIDSKPLTPNQVKYLKESKYFYVWSEWAKTMCHELGYKQVEFLTGIINAKNFYPLKKEKKLELRQRFNIAPNAFIVLDVFRNQIRKMVGQLMEGFSIFRKKNPDIPAYLLLHTFYAEQHGWDILRFREQFGIKPEELLATYVCRNCRNYEIKSYSGEEKNCPYCRAEKSQITINIEAGVTENELNEIYNISDCVIRMADAAGLEMPLVEALYSGTPLGTIPYASQTDFTNQNFVYSINCDLNAIQHGTQFKRAVPSPNSVADFMKYAANLSEAKRLEITEIGRKWALNRYSPEVVGKQWEQLIDSLPYTTWDFNFKQELKNPNAVIPEIENNIEWLKRLYKDILNMDVTDQDEGLRFWISKLKENAPRNEIEKYFRDIAQQENNKITASEFNFNSLFDDNGRKRLLFVIPESIGDILWIASLLEDAAEKYKDFDIYVACKQEMREILVGNPFIYKLIPYYPEFDSLVFLEGQGNNKGLVDIAFLPYVNTQKVLTYMHNNLFVTDYNINKI